MKRYSLVFLGIIISFALTSCSIFYYGYDKSEWDSLSGVEQARVKASYQKTIAEKNRIVNGDPIEEATRAFKSRAQDKIDDRL